MKLGPEHIGKKFRAKNWADKNYYITVVGITTDHDYIFSEDKQGSPDYYCASNNWEEVEEIKTTYQIGQRFTYSNSENEYLLAQVGSGKVCLIGLKDGNRWDDPVRVEHVYEITEEEFKTMWGKGSFELIK